MTNNLITSFGKNHLPYNSHFYKNAWAIPPFKQVHSQIMVL